MSRKCDLLFMTILYVVVHLGLLFAFGHIFMNLLWQYQMYDDSIRAILYDDQQSGKCVNASLVIDHILKQKHETAKSLLMHITYLTAIFVALVIMLSRQFVLIFAYSLFFVLVLAGNLVLPMLTPYHSMAFFLVSTAFGITYVIVYLVVPESSSTTSSKSIIRAPAKAQRSRGDGGRNSHRPRAPPFPVDV